MRAEHTSTRAPPRPAPPTVAPQVVINTLTDAFPDSGGGSIFQLNGSGRPADVGAVKPVA